VVGRASRGFTYLAILFAVAIVSGGLALAGEVWHTAQQREKEAELLRIGDEYRKAIERYYLSGPRQYPRALEDLLKDPRHAGTVRHLRRLYADPVSSLPWHPVPAPDGGIAGVHSVSMETPRKSDGFPQRYQDFSKARTYADWKFVFVPSRQSVTTADGGRNDASR
jgi:type II secretory pathway pseudopilin PulG